MAGVKSIDVYVLSLYVDPAAARGALGGRFSGTASADALARDQALFDGAWAAGLGWVWAIPKRCAGAGTAPPADCSPACRRAREGACRLGETCPGPACLPTLPAPPHHPLPPPELVANDQVPKTLRIVITSGARACIQVKWLVQRPAPAASLPDAGPSHCKQAQQAYVASPSSLPLLPHQAWSSASRSCKRWRSGCSRRSSRRAGWPKAVGAGQGCACCSHRSSFCGGQGKAAPAAVQRCCHHTSCVLPSLTAGGGGGRCAGLCPPV